MKKTNKKQLIDIDFIDEWYNVDKSKSKNKKRNGDDPEITIPFVQDRHTHDDDPDTKIDKDIYEEIFGSKQYRENKRKKTDVNVTLDKKKKDNIIPKRKKGGVGSTRERIMKNIMKIKGVIGTTDLSSDEKESTSTSDCELNIASLDQDINENHMYGGDYNDPWIHFDNE